MAALSRLAVPPASSAFRASIALRLSLFQESSAQLCCRHAGSNFASLRSSSRGHGCIPSSHRFLSATSPPTQQSTGREPPPPPPKPTLRQILSAILGGGFRNLRSALQGQSLRTLFRQNPEEVVLALVCLAVAAGAIVYAVRIYFTYFYHEQFTRYPEPIAKSLRRALYFSNYNPDPQRALKYYRQALEQCEALGLDPFSDDVMGIKIQLAAWLEKIENYTNAAKVLETLLGDCKRWVETAEKSVASGAGQKLDSAVSPGVPDQRTEGQTPPETLWGKRTRVLAKAIGISVKLGELYADEHLLNNELAHERLVWAVEAALRESRRRTTEGLKDGEGEWMSSDAIGGAIEDIPFQVEGPGSPIQGLPSSQTQSPANTRKAYLESAQRWAANAKFHATDTQGEQRTQECDEACAVSLCNLGNIAALSGDVGQARKKFEQCIVMSKKMGFPQGVTQAEAGLKSLAESKSKSD